MEYFHAIDENDSFYGNCYGRYFQHNEYIVYVTNPYGGHYNEGLSIKTFNINTKTFTNSEKLTEVDYNNLQNVDAFFDLINEGLVIDVANKQWAHTSEFPFAITEIDGNCIDTCKFNDKIYIFYSHTEDYQTGSFVFDIKTNTYTTKELPSLHNKTIASCDVYDNNVIISVKNRIYTYNDNNNNNNNNNDNNNNIELIEIINLSNECKKYHNDDIKCYKSILLTKKVDHIYMYDLGNKQLYKSVKICDEGFIYYFDIYDDKLVILSAISGTRMIHLTVKIYNIKEM
jgi:hypothetical protein